jgi:hypothetical protein
LAYQGKEGTSTAAATTTSLPPPPPPPPIIIIIINNNKVILLANSTAAGASHRISTFTDPKSEGNNTIVYYKCIHIRYSDVW